MTTTGERALWKRDRLQLGRKALRLSMYLLLSVLAVVQSFPLVWMLITSVKKSREVFGTFLPKSLDFSNFGKVWFQLNLPLHLWNSVFVTALTVAIVVVVSTMAGYAFSRFRFRGREWLFYAFIAAMMIPGQTILIPMFQFLQALGLLNSLVGLSLSYLGTSVAFGIFLMRAFFEGLPHELAEQGKIDGANEFQVFWHIYLPLTRPGIATVVIIQSLTTWNEFMFSNTYITSPNLKTIQSALYQSVGRWSTDYASLSAGLVLALIPIVAVYLLMQRQFIEGLTAGAVKG